MRVNNFDTYVRVSGLPAKFIDQIKKVYESDAHAVVCGSTAMYLHGALNRLPHDLDVITQSTGLFESCLSEKSEPIPADMSKVDLPLLAKKAKDFYAYIDAVKYQLFGDSNEEYSDITLTDGDYATVTAAWKTAKGEHKPAYRYNSSEHFTYKGSYRQHTKVCLFEASAPVAYVTSEIGPRGLYLDHKHACTPEPYQAVQAAHLDHRR